MKQLFILFYYLRTKYFRRFKTRLELEAWQETQIRKALKRILPRSGFYRERFAGRSIAQWREIPVIGKTEMMENLSSLNTRGIDRDQAFELALKAERTRDFSPMIGKITVGLSSGTSGSRGLFLVSPKERLQHAGTILAKVLPGSIFSRHRVAFFLRADSNLYSTSTSSRLEFHFFDLLKPVESHLKKLQELRPTLLIAPPSLLRMLAQAQLEGVLAISPLKIISVAEVLDPVDESLIKRVFGQIVHQVYQCTEGFLGATCRFGKLHLNEDVAMIEKDYVDRKLGKFYPIITDFSRTTQPIIRYRLNDILTESKTLCECGSPFQALETIEGRSDDLLIFSPASGDRTKRTVFPDFIRRAIIAASGEIEEYRVVQKSVDTLTVALKSKSVVESEGLVKDSIRNMLAELGCREPLIEFDHSVLSAEHLSGGKKLRRVTRAFSLESVK